MQSYILKTTALLAAFNLIGCGTSTAPKARQAEQAKVSEAQWTSVTIHIQGFKKSKSGAT